MTFKEYMPQANLTMKALGSPLLDSIHMVLGLSSEFLEEFINACYSQDEVNVKEEFGDLQWYLANYAIIWNLEVTEDLEYSDTLDPAHIFTVTLGKMSDLDKKLFAYGKTVDNHLRQNVFDTLFTSLKKMAELVGVDLSESREKNIKKLRARYADKFSEYEAINRNVAEEYKILSE
jgi:NTP pyrophosphatase (non-canonical NTP hydrolase)